jgi:hypothetical protein
MQEKTITYKSLFTNKSFLISLITSIIFLYISIVINFYAGNYATRSISNPVTDIILSNIRVFDLDSTFVYGSMIFIICIIVVFLHKPQRIPFTIKSLALFVITRSIFITLTHVAPFPSQTVINSVFMSNFSFGGDLFFSGHTGMPFLLALIYWKDIWTRFMFIGFSVGFAVVVLLAHIHYSIDVLSAFFITYTIFHIAKYLFKHDRQVFFRM